MISRSLFFVRHASELTPNAFSLYLHSLLWAGKCGTCSSVSLSEKIAADSFCLFCRGFYSCDLFKTQFRLNMYQTLLAESEICVHTENSRNATSHLICRNKLSSLQTFLLNKKGSAIPAILFLYYNQTHTVPAPDLHSRKCGPGERVTRWDAAPICPPRDFHEKGISEGENFPTAPTHVSLHWSSRLWWPQVDSVMCSRKFLLQYQRPEQIAEPGATALLSLFHGMQTTQGFPSSFILLDTVHVRRKV